MRTHLIRLMFAAALLVAFYRRVVRAAADVPGKVVDESRQAGAGRRDGVRGTVPEPDPDEQDRQQGRVPDGRAPVRRLPDHDEKGRRGRGYLQDADHAGPEHSRHDHLAASGGRRSARRGGGNHQPRCCRGQGHGGAAGAGQDRGRASGRRPQRRGDRRVHRGCRQGTDLRRLFLESGRRLRQQEAVRRSRDGVQEGRSSSSRTTSTRIHSWQPSTTSQKKFDLAAEESALAAKYSAGADGAAGGGGNAEALYNQGVALFNGGKFAEAKTAFRGRDERPTPRWRWRTTSSG